VWVEKVALECNNGKLQTQRLANNFTYQGLKVTKIPSSPKQDSAYDIYVECDVGLKKLDIITCITIKPKSGIVPRSCLWLVCLWYARAFKNKRSLYMVNITLNYHSWFVFAFTRKLFKVRRWSWHFLHFISQIYSACPFYAGLVAFF